MSAFLALVCTSIISGSVLGYDTSSTFKSHDGPIFLIDKSHIGTNNFGNAETIQGELTNNRFPEKGTKVGKNWIEIIKLGWEILEIIRTVVDDKQAEDNFKEIFDKLDRNFQAIGTVQETIDQMMVYSMDAFETLQKRLNQSTEEIMADIDKVGNKVDRNFGYLLQIFEIASETYTVVEKTRFEMHDEFHRALDYAKSSRIEPIVTRLNNFVFYFSNEKGRISQLARDERIANLREENGFLQHLRDSRTPKGDSLQSFLDDIMSMGFAIPQNTNDTVAYAALSSLYYGVITEISVMRYLVRVNIYLADESYRNRDIEGFNRCMEQVLTDYQSFKETLIRSRGLIDRAIDILKRVAALGFPGCGDENSPDNLLKRAKYLAQEKLNITDATLPLIRDGPVKLMAQFKFDERSPKTPIGPWVDGAKVRYAVQYRNSDNMYSKVGPWSEPFSVSGLANPILQVPADSTYTRLIFRRFNNEVPQFVGVIEHGTQIHFWDIDRDVYNAASGSDETKAINEAEKLIAIGANISAKFDLHRSAIHAAAEIGNVKFAKNFLLNDSAAIIETDANGYTALHIAAEEGWEKFVDLTMQHGGSVNSQTHSGSTPLHLAVNNGHPAAVQILLNTKDVDVNAQDDQKVGPLHLAVQKGFKSILQTLLDDGRVDMNLESNGSLTSLHISALLPDTGITGELLYAHGTRLNVRSNGNMTALHYATLGGNLPALKLMVNQDGTDVNAISVNNWAPLHYAVSLRRSNIVTELLKMNNTIVNILAAGQLTPLHLAAATDQADVVAQLLEHGAEIELPTKEGLTALKLAIINFNKDIVAALLSKGADISSRTANGSTILHLAAAIGNMPIIEYVLELGNISLGVRDNEMETPIETARRLGHSDVAELLMHRMAIINSCLIKAAENGELKNVTFLLKRGAELNTNNTVGETPLHKAAYNGHIDVAKYLVNMSAEVDRRDAAGETPLHKAVRNDSLEMIDYLLKMGADVNTQSANGWTPLHVAITVGRTQIVEALLKLQNIKVDLPSSDLLSPLHMAAINGTFKFVDELIGKGAVVDQPNKEGLTALHLAAVNDHHDIMDLLLKKGANVNARSTNGSTILHLAVARCTVTTLRHILEIENVKMSVRDDHMNTPLLLAIRGKVGGVVDLLKQYIGDISITALVEAVKYGHLDEVRSLLLRGADVEGTDKDGRTPLLWAAAKGHLDIAKYLVENGAMIDHRDHGSYGECTPLWWAAYWGHVDVVEFLLKNGAFYDAVDSSDRTPLMWAAFNGYFVVVKELVESGASVNIRNVWGETALFWARKNNHQDVARYLVAHGAK